MFRKSREHRVVLLGVLASAACGSHDGDEGDLPLGTQQYTFTMAAFEVPPNGERYQCQDVPNPFGEDIAILKTESTMSAGAHHMYAFQIPSTEAAFAPGAGLYAAESEEVADSGVVQQPFVPDGETTPLFDCPEGGLEFHPYFHLTQIQHDSITYPDGVGRSLKASEAIRLSIHYLNTSAAPIQVGAQVTVSYVPASAVQQLAAGIFVSGGSLNVPTGVSTQTFSYSVPVDLKLLQFTGHMHSRGRSFEAHATSRATGEVRPLYSSSTWDEPAQLDLAPPFEMKQRDTVDYSCTYDNGTGGTLTYGPSAASNEMCNFFGVYYPAADGAGLVGAL